MDVVAVDPGDVDLWAEVLLTLPKQTDVIHVEEVAARCSISEPASEATLWDDLAEESSSLHRFWINIEKRHFCCSQCGVAFRCHEKVGVATLRGSSSNWVALIGKGGTSCSRLKAVASYFHGNKEQSENKVKPQKKCCILLNEPADNKQLTDIHNNNFHLKIHSITTGCPKTKGKEWESFLLSATEAELMTVMMKHKCSFGWRTWCSGCGQPTGSEQK